MMNKKRARVKRAESESSPSPVEEEMAQGFCWKFWHEWAKWAIVEERQYGYGHKMVQKRRCVKCGFVELKYQEI